MLGTCVPKQLWTYGDFSDQLSILGDKLPRLVDYCSESLANGLEQMPVVLPKENSKVDGARVAYIMFTSGSTGFPKAAAISHANLLNFMAWGRTT